MAPIRLTSLPGSAALLETLLNIDQGRGPLSGFFEPGQELFAARAPGRLDVIGGIADCVGASVLGWPTVQAAWAVVQWETGGRLELASADPRGAQQPRRFGIPVSELANGDLAALRRRLTAEAEDHWAAYPAMAVALLNHEQPNRLSCGLRLLIVSSVPESRGVGSSAAIGVATLKILCNLLGTPRSGSELALLCQRVETLAVGAPCSITDPMTASVGQSDRLLELLCQPALVTGQLPLPPGLGFFGIDSGIPDEPGKTVHRAVQTAALMGHRIIAEWEGLPSCHPDESVPIEDPRYHGTLANLSEPELERRYLAALPETLRGDEFLARYSALTEPLHCVEPDRVYPIRAATAHSIREHQRVKRYGELLRADPDPDTAYQLGKLMLASHESQVACGLTSPATERIVTLTRMLGPVNGLFGARMTGTGGGGVVTVLARPDAEPLVLRAAERYAEESGQEGFVFAGSSPGADAVGTFRLKPSLGRREAEPLPEAGPTGSPACTSQGSSLG